jgi:hypothetical protein
MEGVKHDNLACAYYDTFVRCTKGTRTANQNLKPLVKIDSPIVINICGVHVDPIRILTTTEILASSAYRLY